MQIPIEFGGRRFVLDDQLGTDLVAYQMREGGYEAPLPMLTLAVLCRREGIFLDIGANNGLYSVLACSARPGIKSIAFEPYPAAIAALDRNIAANHLSERIQIREIALSDEDGVALLYIPDPRHGLLETSCSLESDFKSDDSKRCITIAKMRLDSLSDKLPKIALIKVDIEGHELSFLRGAQQTLRTHRPIVFAEMLPASQHTFHAVTELIDGINYNKFRMRADMVIESPSVIVDDKAWNYAFIPSEQMHIFEDCCTSHGLEIFSEYKAKNLRL